MVSLMYNIVKEVYLINKLNKLSSKYSPEIIAVVKIYSP